ncbi:MAG: M1 family metallopeptidase [Bacteroidetes bacterium]|nr:M1 family metallopeptidase [Bacteroidota bacterium]
MPRQSTLATLAGLLIIAIQAVGQTTSYPLPRNWQQALAKGTRTTTGEPGPNYWQNHARYQFDVSVSVKKRLLKGQGTITYFNQSPDTLDRLVFNLYQDIFRMGNSRDWDVGTPDLHSGTTINSLQWDGVTINPNDQTKVNRLGTKLVLRTGRKVFPGDSTVVSISWEVPIPATRTIRMGKYSDSVVFVAYWYPQVAVYDDIDGWDMISYGGSVEFYNDFNDYLINIKVPKGYVAWATGLIQNRTEVFSDLILARLHQAESSTEVVRVIDVADYRKKQVFRKHAPQVFRFEARHVPDFSFGLGHGLVWDAVAVSTDADGNHILASAVYPAGARHWNKVAYFSQLSIEYMSKQMPGIPFPYPHMTTMHNGKAAGGMETPMMAINGAPSQEQGNFSLTFHEIAHTYMPFYMGTNEKKYAWMDEGWATLWPHKLTDSLYPSNNYIAQLIRGYENQAGTENDLPPMVPNQFMAANYPSLRLASYVRPALAYYFLEQTLGSGLFRKALQHYMHTWNGKHPIPLDFFAAFEKVADQDLSWFFMPWFYQSAYADLALRKITPANEVVVENSGGLPLPVHITVTFADDTTEDIVRDARVWQNGTTLLLPISSNKPVREVKLGNPLIPDVNKKDNILIYID